MEAKLTRLTHRIAIQLNLVAESCTICSSRSRQPVRKLLDTPSYRNVFTKYNFKLSTSALQNIHIMSSNIVKIVQYVKTYDALYFGVKEVLIKFVALCRATIFIVSCRFPEILRCSSDLSGCRQRAGTVYKLFLLPSHVLYICLVKHCVSIQQVIGIYIYSPLVRRAT
jgi:hypothetical protein